jgi:transcription elongation factor Elf1
VKRLVCLFRGHDDRSAGLELEDDRGFRVVECRRCGRRKRELELDPSAICSELGHDRDGDVLRDELVGVQRSGVGEVVEVTFERVTACGRCGFPLRGPVPPEEIPVDVFERVELEIEQANEIVGALQFQFSRRAGTKPGTAGTT